MVITNTKACLQKYPGGKEIVVTGFPDSFEFFVQTSKALAPLFTQAESLVQFLQRAYYVKIDEIVFDFI